MRINIRKGLLISFLGLFFLEIIIIGAGIFNIKRLSALNQRSLTLMGNMEEVYEVLLSFERLIMPIKDYLIHGNIIKEEAFKIYAAETKKNIAEVKDVFFKEGRPELITGIENEFQRINEGAGKIFQIDDPVGNIEAAILIEDTDALINKAIDELDEYHQKYMDKQLLEVRADSQRLIKYSRLLFLSFSLFGILLSLLLSYYLNRRINGPITYLTRVCKRISSGQRNQKITMHTQDEFEELAGAFNKMIEELNRDEVSMRTANQELAKWSSLLEEKVAARTEELQESKQELEKRIYELERMHNITIDRELRMKELKQEMEELKKKLKPKEDKDA